MCSNDLIYNRDHRRKKRQERQRPLWVPLDQGDEEWETAKTRENSWCNGMDDRWQKVISREEFYFMANRDRTFVKGDDHVMNNKSGLVCSVLNPAQWRSNQPNCKPEFKIPTPKVPKPDLKTMAQRPRWQAEPDKLRPVEPPKVPRMNRELNGRDDWVGQAEASNHDAESHCPWLEDEESVAPTSLTAKTAKTGLTGMSGRSRSHASLATEEGKKRLDQLVRNTVAKRAGLLAWPGQ